MYSTWITTNSSGHDVIEYQLDTSGLHPSLYMFVVENPSVIITVVTDSPQKPWKNRLKITKHHGFSSEISSEKKKLLMWCDDYIT